MTRPNAASESSCIFRCSRIGRGVRAVIFNGCLPSVSSQPRHSLDPLATTVGHLGLGFIFGVKCFRFNRSSTIFEGIPAHPLLLELCAHSCTLFPAIKSYCTFLGCQSSKSNKCVVQTFVLASKLRKKVIDVKRFALSWGS